jgi:hypothetical protein
MRKIYILVLFPLLLSCRPLPSLLLLLDPYTAELLAAGGRNEAGLRRELRSDFRLRVRTLEPQSEAASEAERLVQAAGADWVFLGPLLPLDAEALAARFPEVRFLREQANPPFAPNLRSLHFRWEEAYRGAGAVAGRLVASPSLRQLLGEGSSRGPAKAGLLLSVPTPRGRLQAEAFREGFLAEAGADLLVERTIGSQSDTAQARRVLEEMRQDGVALFMLKTYALSGYCLEFLRAEGGRAILEQAAGSRAYPDQAVLWMEEDLVGALRGLASAPEGQPVSGPVRLHPGEALRSEAARAELAFAELVE